MIEVKNVTKTYGEGDSKCVAIDKLSVTIGEGCFTAIVGKSGSGKTTLLNILGSVDLPDKGEVWIDGRDITKLRKKELSEYRRNTIGIVYQFFDLIPVLTLQDNILIANEYAPRVEEAYYRSIIERLDIEDILKKYPDQISGGQKQRVAIARALVNHPKLILADEPTGNLDEINSECVISLLLELTGEYGMTLIMVTHDMDIARRADAVITLADGKICL